MLDANVAIAALNGVRGVRERLATVAADDVALPVVALAELTFGAYKSRKREENLQRLQSLRGAIPVIPLTDGIVDLYGSTRASLEARGVVKSDFDLLIACTALDANATLVTNDGSLLDGSIDGLRAENWLP